MLFTKMQLQKKKKKKKKKKKIFKMVAVAAMLDFILT